MFSKFINIEPFQFSVILIILFNIFLFTTLNLGLFDHTLNILISVGIYEYLKKKGIKKKKNYLILS